MPITALLLDLDGSLLDSNARHAEAWARAAAEAGHDLPPHRFDREIGKGGDQLVADVFGPDAEETQGDALRDAQGRHIGPVVRERGVAMFDGAEALVDAARARGLKVALATSADEENLDLLFGAAGTDLRPRMDAVLTASGVDASKPEPDVVRAAARKLGVAPSACALVGDTVYDGDAAWRAGAAFLAVATWVWDEALLTGAGAAFVAPTTAAMAEQLGEALDAAEARQASRAGDASSGDSSGDDAAGEDAAGSSA